MPERRHKPHSTPRRNAAINLDTTGIACISGTRVIERQVYKENAKSRKMERSHVCLGDDEHHVELSEGSVAAATNDCCFDRSRTSGLAPFSLTPLLKLVAELIGEMRHQC